MISTPITRYDSPTFQQRIIPQGSRGSRLCIRRGRGGAYNRLPLSVAITLNFQVPISDSRGRATNSFISSFIHNLLLLIFHWNPIAKIPAKSKKKKKLDCMKKRKTERTII